MKIAMGSDHAGFPLKEEIKKVLLEQGYEVEDVGCYSPERFFPASMSIIWSIRVW